MKRRDLEKHLRKHGCELHHHGGDHDMWINMRNDEQTAVPRHAEIKFGLICAICKQLDVPRPHGH